MNQEKEVSAELLISEILRWGVRASLAIIVAGVVLSFLGPHGYMAEDTGAELQALLHGGTSFPRSFSWFWSGLARLDGTAVAVAGLGLLILTPVLRVVASVGAFAWQRDRVYTIVTTVVLAVVVASMFLGFAA